MNREKRINRIANKLGCELFLRTGIYPQMFVEREPPLVHGPLIKTQADYFIILHELGHVALDHTQGKSESKYYTNGVLKSESEAWEYALENANEEPEEDTLNMIRFNLGTYIDEAKRANGRAWHLRRPSINQVDIWKSPPFTFDSYDYALTFLDSLSTYKNV